MIQLKLALLQNNVVRFYENVLPLEQEEKFNIWNTWNIQKTSSKSKTNPEMYDEDLVALSDIEDTHSLTGSLSQTL